VALPVSQLKSLFLTTRFFGILAAVVVAYVVAFFWPPMHVGAHALLVLLLGLVATDLTLLYGWGGGLSAERTVPNRFSNGDENEVVLHLQNQYDLPVRCHVLDELPVELQVRDQSITVTVPPHRRRTIRYTVRPTRRGAYEFGAINVYATTPLRLVERRFREEATTEVPVYPSFKQVQKYDLLAASDRLEEVGIKKVRRVGHTMEFDRIREYVPGDDRRAVNWKATARRGDLMVNVYQDERAQPVYCVLNMGRVMELPFEGMTLLDHSINASLMMANVALRRQDRAGLLTFSHEMGPVVTAERRSHQLRRLQEQLYRLETDFREASYRRLATFVRSNVRQRSLLLLFTNFTARSSMARHLSSLQLLARRHPLVVVVFENTELTCRMQQPAQTTEDVYVRGMAEKFAYEKQQIVRDLRRRGIYAVLTPPEDLTVHTINKYIELKARGVI
jgi:uncharacterized protein (DUF58 family)